MGILLTMANDDVYDMNHLDDSVARGFNTSHSSHQCSVINFEVELKKKDYIEAMERIAAAEDEFDW
ncbi:MULTISPECIES: hypothetical protein [Enterobacter cloacae complex]|uniref:hypothetical protein n=1 Tax=Enterobacter cloacae complex TaxID=354276 RepID=UPI0004A0606D|nr:MULTISPECIES: hypothetical protein [Enterobacter cloacae complex]KDF48314.1 hypothetical protein AE42_00302 [Enterobacter kobei]MCK6826153.1 hypothetical protein [Enterobacter kobei]MCM7488183.1 hypothetical protein [Enterobacter kobei]QBC04782.1 hypothetical protein EWI30_23025 [Enterobacter cloacae]HCR1909651.1 hypothetical protein [Enterobacter kobei]